MSSKIVGKSFIEGKLPTRTFLAYLINSTFQQPHTEIT